MLAAAAAAAAAVVPVLGRLLRAHDGRPAGAIVSASGFSGRRLLHSRPVRTTLTGGYQVGKPGLPTWTTVKGSETHREKERDTHTHTHTHTHNRKGGGPHRNSLAWQNEPSALAAGRRSLEDLIGWADTSLSSPFNAHVRSRSLPFSARLLIDRLSLVDIVTTVQDCAPIPVPLFFFLFRLFLFLFFSFRRTGQTVAFSYDTKAVCWAQARPLRRPGDSFPPRPAFEWQARRPFVPGRFLRPTDCCPVSMFRTTFEGGIRFVVRYVVASLSSWSISLCGHVLGVISVTSL